jgi:hypothetical protein
MARHGIQYADVQQAIDALLTRGDTPSVQRIREVLGTGSFTTISEHFRHWRKEREQNRDVPPPKGVPEAVVTLATDMWRQAQDVANEGLVHYREEANRRVEAAQEEELKATREAENAAQRERALAEHLHHREERMEALGAQLADSQAQQSALLTRCKGAEQESAALAKDNAGLQTRLEQQASEHARQREDERDQFGRQLAEEQQRNEATEGKLLALLDSVRQERADDDKAQRKRTQQLQARLDTSNEEGNEARRKLKAAQDAQAQWQRRFEQAEEEARTQHEAAGKLSEEAERLYGKLSRAERTLEAEREQRVLETNWQVSLSQRLDALQQQVATLPTAPLAEDDTPAEQQSNSKPET